MMVFQKSTEAPCRKWQVRVASISTILYLIVTLRATVCDGDLPGRLLDGGAAAEDLQRFIEVSAALDQVVRAIDQEVDTKIADLHGLIRAEIIHLEEYMAEMSEQDDEGRRIGRRIGGELFAAAIERMDKVVLKAEVGLIDVAWQEKRQKSEDVRKGRSTSGKQQSQEGRL